MPIPELIPRLPEIIAGRNHRSWPDNLHSGATGEVADAVGSGEFDFEGDGGGGFVGFGPVFGHTQRLRHAHLDQGAGVSGGEVDG